MAAVIYIHGCDTNASAESITRWLSFPVPCFLVMAAFLAQWSQFGKKQAYVESLGKRVKRLVVPYLGWSLVYVVVRWAKSKAIGETFDADLIGIIFWGDAAHQLYFVPLLVYLFAVWLIPLQLGRISLWWVSAICLVGFVAANLIEAPLNASLPDDRYFIAKSLVWFPLGIMIAIATQCLESIRWGLFVILGGASIGSTMVVEWETYWITISLIVLALARSIPAPSWLAYLAKISFGVYLGHVLIIESLQFAVLRVGLPLESLAITLLVIFSSAVLSVALCALLDRSKHTSWLVQ